MKYCPDCGKETQDAATFCIQCGARLDRGSPAEPGSMPARSAAAAPARYEPAGSSPQARRQPFGDSPSMAAAEGRLMRWDGTPLAPEFAERKILVGIMAIVFGQLGVHKFILGYIGPGLIMLGISLVSYVLTMVIVGFIGVAAMSIIGIIEGVIYLTKTDDDFIVSYGLNRKNWF